MTTFTREMLTKQGWTVRADGSFDHPVKGGPKPATTPRGAKRAKRGDVAKIPKPESRLSLDFKNTWELCLGPTLEPEMRFHPVRKWRFDFAHPATMIAIELDGGVFQKGGGRHTRGAGYCKDAEKLNAAASAGWTVFRLATSMITTPKVREIIAAILSRAQPITPQCSMTRRST